MHRLAPAFKLLFIPQPYAPKDELLMTSSYRAKILPTVSPEESKSEYSFSLLHSGLLRSHDCEKKLCICSCSGRGVVLPQVILVAVGVVANATDYETRAYIHDTGGLHLKAKNIIHRSEVVSRGSTLHHPISFSSSGRL